MSATAEKTDPKLWETVKAEVTAGAKGGKAGQWSARKAQMAVLEYKRRGGGFKGEKPDADNHLLQWEKEEWGTKSGGESLETGERYLPKRRRETLTGRGVCAHHRSQARRPGRRPPVRRPAGGQSRGRPRSIAAATANGATRPRPTSWPWPASRAWSAARA
jgi:hypothetical protein